MANRKMTKRESAENLEPTVIIERVKVDSMLPAIETILEIVEDSSLSTKYLDALEPYFAYISDLQGITSIQAVMLAVIIEGSSDGNIVTISNIARFLNCKRIHIMKYQKDIDDLVSRKLIRKVKKNYSNDAVGYIVPENVIEAFKNNQRFDPKPLKAKDGIQFLQMLSKLIHQRKKEEIDTGQLKMDFEDLMEANNDLCFVRLLKELNLPIDSQLIVSQMARYLVLKREESVTADNLSILFDDEYERYEEITALETGRHILMEKNILKYGGLDEFCNNRRYCLTNGAVAKLLKEYYLPKKTASNLNVHKASNIMGKELFFNDEVSRQIDNLSELLSVNNFTAIQTRLKEKGRRTGFACLFYGAPGTGKTESVLQLARKTGRDIMQVEISEIKSKWVGESEQNIKAVFDNYRAFCKTCETTPILLFNEADGVLGTRMGHAEREVDRMENTIQNIILQEMETLDGIMIATTNLEQNFDSAFERRFIYKVRFERPDVIQRKQIWQSMLPKLSDDEALQLACNYNFNGGQIENIVRKCDVESILYGETAVDASKIQDFCHEESITKQLSHIGFV